MINKKILSVIILLGAVAFPMSAKLNLPTKKLGKDNYYYYEVKKNETIFDIANKIGVTKDDIIKYNADFQKDAGLHPIIRRVWSGSYGSHDTRHTDNCEELAGEWEYGDEPRETYMRHEGCRCTVEYLPSRLEKGWTTALSKYEVARNGELFSKEETLERRIKDAARRKELDRKYRR